MVNWLFQFFQVFFYSVFQMISFQSKQRLKAYYFFSVFLLLDIVCKVFRLRLLFISTQIFTWLQMLDRKFLGVEIGEVTFEVKFDVLLLCVQRGVRAMFFKLILLKISKYQINYSFQKSKNRNQKLKIRYIAKLQVQLSQLANIQQKCIIIIQKKKVKAKDMFEMLLGKKRKNTNDAFQIPVRNFVYDPKIISKLGIKEIKDLAYEQDKYITILTKKLETVRDDFNKNIQRCDQLIQKNQIINKEFKKMTNQHQELSIKYSNIQLSLEALATQKIQIVEKQVQFIINSNLIKSEEVEGLKDLNKILTLYRNKFELCSKIEAQNKRLKENYIQLQNKLEQFQNTITKTNQLQEIQCQNIEKLQKIQLPAVFQQNNNSNKENKFQQQGLTKDQLLDIQSDVVQISKLTQQQNPLNGCQGQTLKQGLDLTNQLVIEQQKCLNIQQDNNNKHINLEQSEKMQINMLQQTQMFAKKIQQLQNEIKRLSLISNKLEQEKKNMNNQLIKKDNYVKQIQNLLQKEKVCITNLEKDVASLQKQYEKAREDKLNSERNKEQNQMLISEYKVKMEQFLVIGEELRQVKEQNTKLQKSQKSNTKQIFQLKIKQKNHQQEIQILQNKIQKYQENINDLTKKAQKFDQDINCKQRKHQSDLNQQRIKNQNLKRSNTNLETKIQELNASINKFYEQNIVKNNKIMQMEQKLKQYKVNIQQLKKEKQEMEKSYEQKLIDIIEQNQEKINQLKPTKSERSNKSKKQKVNEDDQNNQMTLKSKIVDLEDKNTILQQQVNKLTEKIKQQEEQNLKKQLQIQQLNQKRQMSMKQIQRLSKNSNPLQDMISPRDGFGREKKIAQKAYRGFDILIKLNHNLYKQFVSAFSNQLKDTKFASIQNSINILINKSTDMKDIFEDYL